MQKSSSKISMGTSKAVVPFLAVGLILIMTGTVWVYAWGGNGQQVVTVTSTSYIPGEVVTKTITVAGSTTSIISTATVPTTTTQTITKVVTSGVNTATVTTTFTTTAQPTATATTATVTKTVTTTTGIPTVTTTTINGALVTSTVTVNSIVTKTITTTITTATVNLGTGGVTANIQAIPYYANGLQLDWSYYGQITPIYGGNILTVDGTDGLYQYTSTWQPGTYHVVCAATQLQDSYGDTFTFSSWSDGGGTLVGSKYCDTVIAGSTSFQLIASYVMDGAGCTYFCLSGIQVPSIENFSPPSLMALMPYMFIIAGGAFMVTGAGLSRRSR